MASTLRKTSTNEAEAVVIATQASPSPCGRSDFGAVEAAAREMAVRRKPRPTPLSKMSPGPYAVVTGVDGRYRMSPSSRASAATSSGRTRTFEFTSAGAEVTSPVVLIGAGEGSGEGSELEHAEAAPSAKLTITRAPRHHQRRRVFMRVTILDVAATGGLRLVGWGAKVRVQSAVGSARKSCQRSCLSWFVMIVAPRS